MILMPETKKYFEWTMIQWAGLGGFATGIYFAFKFITLYKNKKSKRKDQENIKTSSTARQTNFSSYYFDKNLQIQLLEEKLPRNLTARHIYLSAPTIVQDQFIKFTRQIRKSKRAFILIGRRLIRKTDEEVYIDLILYYEREIYDLLIRSRMQLVEYLNILPEEMVKLEEDYDLFADIRSLEREALMILKQQILKHGKIKIMSEEKLIMILDDQIAFVKNKMYYRIKKKLQKDITLGQNQIFAIVQALEDDIIYDKYGYEPEDIESKIRQTSIDTGQRDECQAQMKADVIDFNFQSESNSQQEIWTGSLGKSVPTMVKSSGSSEHFGYQDSYQDPYF